MACLSSRIPSGEPVTPEKLAMVERAENLLRDFGFHDVRVRHHEMSAGAAAGRSSSGPVRCLARIEVGLSELPRLLETGPRELLTGELKKLGYTHVTVDLEGYRRGIMQPG